MKNILKVTILFCFIISLFVIPSFADSLTDYFDLSGGTLSNDGLSYTFTSNGYLKTKENRITFVINFYNAPTDSYGSSTCPYKLLGGGSFARYWYDTAYDGLEVYQTSNGLFVSSSSGKIKLKNYRNNTNLIDTGVSDGVTITLLEYNGNSVVPDYNKNPNVDEFIANTLISMGVKFDTPAYALSYASAAWDWCIDEENIESAHPFDVWNIDTFVSYCNAQSNNYLNWYNGYKLHEDVTKALGEYIRQNIRSLTGLPPGITSLQGAYLPIYHYGSGFQSGVSSPTAQTFYPAQTITYFNGEYINETDDISTSQFLYSPADVRRFLGYPATGSVVIPSDPAAGTGTITDDPNNPDQKNIEINFPSLDWLADAINSILDFLRNALTTLADLLTQLLDAILGLFSDAFASLADFGQGIIDFLQSVFAGLSTLLNGYVPSDLAVIIACFIALNFGIGLITFILKGH